MSGRATRCFGFDRSQFFGEQGFVLSETCPASSEGTSEMYAPRRPACSRMLPCAARTATFTLRACTRAPAAGKRREIDLELMAHAVGPRTPAGTEGVVMAAMW